jgi:hypothetical protein
MARATVDFVTRSRGQNTMKSKYLMIAALLSLFALAGCKRPETAPTETPPPAAQDNTMAPQPETTPPAETPPPEQTPPSDQPEQQPPQQ